MSIEPGSQLWYRVANLTPKLAGHACLQRQTFRGQIEYVLNNRVSGRFFRVSDSAQHFAALMDGTRSVQEILEATNTYYGEQALSQEQAIDLLGKLYTAEVLQADTHADVGELMQRQSRLRQSEWKKHLKNPLAIKLPLFDPDRLLDYLALPGKVLFSKWSFLLWLLVVASALLSTLSHWTELVNDTSMKILSPQNLLLLGICYPLIKALHELAHGMATKVWGGHVHETGIILMALMPIPYVDASAASLFPEKIRRMVVGAAGIMVELLLASLALLLWFNTEPGLVHSLAYNTMLIGSVSTLLFNGNPLLRFDGYYIFSDFIGIPNLAAQSNRYLGYLVQRYLFGATDLVSPAAMPDQRAWLAGYGVLSLCYRLVILTVIILFVAETYPFAGLLIAVWASMTLIVMPLFKQVKFIVSAPRLQRCRVRAIATSSGAAALTAALLFAVPFPLSTSAEGVVAPPDRSQLRAGGDAVIVRLLAEPDSPVRQGDPLIETQDPLLSSEIRILEAELQELTIKRQAHQTHYEQVKAVMLDREIDRLRGDLKDARERADDLLIRSPADGVFLLEQAVDMPGRFVRRGDHLGYVADRNRPVVRVPVPQADIGMLRNGIEAVNVRLAENIGQVLAVSVSRQVPAAVDYLPSSALGSLGGGRFAVDPQDASGLRLLEPVFEIELTLPVELARIGERVYVHFQHGSEPLATQWYRRLRQLFLRRFSV
jgi:putative peptide zinc metalloprotease protein